MNNKKSSELATKLLKLAVKFERKLAQQQDITPQLNQALAPYGYAVVPGTVANPSEAGVDVKIQSGNKAKWRGRGVAEMDQIKKLLDPVTMSLLNLTSKPIIYT